jgi:inosine-uridine nucleoside N-ribohydrolase
VVVQLFIDSDNALGSDRGDVDDAYAIAALLKSDLPVAAISSVAGNVEEPEAHENNRRLSTLLGWSGSVLRGAEARAALSNFEGRVVALGPLTNVAAAVRAREIIMVGADSASRGRWPPLWPHELNLTFDRQATLRVFASSVPLTILPLNVARELRVSRRDLDAITGSLGRVLRSGTERWFRYLFWMRRTRRFGIYDLAAALYAIDDAGFAFEETTATMRANTFIEFGRGTRRVKVCRALDRKLLWQRFLSIVQLMETSSIR